MPRSVIARKWAQIDKGDNRGPLSCALRVIVYTLYSVGYMVLFLLCYYSPGKNSSARENRRELLSNNNKTVACLKSQYRPIYEYIFNIYSALEIACVP